MSLFDFTQESYNIESDVCLVPSHSYSNLTDNILLNSSHNDYIRYIITFNTYKSLNIHTSYITNLLNKSFPNINDILWKIIARNNRAIYEYPTDFLIIQISNKYNNDITSYLNTLTNIKYINNDKIIRKNLLQYKQTGGKLFTKWSMNEYNSNRELLSNFLITDHLEASILWDDGYFGDGVNVAIFDTGIDENHSHFNNIDERTNWTDEDQLNDGIGHGTFVCGIIASKYKQCPGFAPNAIIHTFRVFTNQQMSYTSWFLDAFNYAIYRKMNLLNLSIGGPDWLDLPFVDKVREMQANNVIMITACGNDGKYGTINNPADQLSVIGVGGITQNNHHIAQFQSRGMTTWELPYGYGRIKPDIVTVGQSLYGSSINGNCRTLSGTSVASPVVTGVSALLTSVVPYNKRWDIINPASLKQILIESADKIDGLRIFEQGNGKINLISAYKTIRDYSKHISSVPDSLDFKECPLFWPFCKQPLYYTSQPYIFNLTLLNPFSVIGEIYKTPKFNINSIVFNDGKIIKKDIKLNDYISIEFKYNRKLWPWCGWLGVYIYAKQNTQYLDIESVSGNIEIEINVIDDDINRPYVGGDSKWIKHKLSIPYSLKIIPTPPKEKRLLWDQFHNLQYPLGYFPRDDLEKDNDMLDWFGDHLHTNYHTLYDHIKLNGYFIEILRFDYSCIDPDLYSTLIIVDIEDKFNEKELKKLQYDVFFNKLSIIIFGDWYNNDLMNDVRFFDDNTRSLWDALNGGANIPALNQLLSPFNIQFSDYVGVGDININNKYKTYLQSGNVIYKSPINSFILMQNINKVIRGNKNNGKQINSNKDNVIVASLYDTNNINNINNGGRIAVFGDSTCLDANQHKINCFWLFDMFLEYVINNKINNEIKNNLILLDNNNYNNIFNDKYYSLMNLPQKHLNSEILFNSVSRVHNMKHVKCFKNLINITDNIIIKEEKHNYNRKQQEISLIQASVPLNNDNMNMNKNNNNNNNGYKIIMNPHISGNIHDPLHNIMLLYPFMIILIFLMILCIFCRPIRKLFLSDKCISKYIFCSNSKLSSPLLIRKVIKKTRDKKTATTDKQTEHFHV